MVTRLEVDGFKSLRNFAVDLEPFTVFAVDPGHSAAATPSLYFVRAAA